jgi:formamidopyrimidine-DNA glycosylase
MPELPEVETIANELRLANLLGRTIKSVRVQWPKTVQGLDVNKFIAEIVNRRIIDISRRAKYLIFRLDNDYYLFIHFRMTGRFILTSSDTPPLSPYIRLELILDDGRTLYFHDTRKFGRWILTKDFEAISRLLGPEPLSEQFSLKEFTTSLTAKKRALKPLLLDQHFIAGLGNIYVDEALWEARLHPLQPASNLNADQAQHLFQAIQRVLKKGIQRQGTTLGTGRTNFYRVDGSRGKHQDLLNVFRRTGAPCPRCGHKIERIIVAQRSTHFCPACQPGPFY